MHHFFSRAMQLLQRYKGLLKKQYSADEYQQKLQELGLNRRLPQQEAELYNLIEYIINKTEAETPQQTVASGLRFSGSSQSIQDMRELLALYRLESEQGRVIHTSQLASRAMVEAIQLMVLPTTKRDATTASRLDSCSLKVAQYGIKEQHLSFWHSLKTQVNQNDKFFLPLLDRFQRYLEEHAGAEYQLEE